MITGGEHVERDLPGMWQVLEGPLLAAPQPHRDLFFDPVPHVTLVKLVRGV